MGAFRLPRRCELTQFPNQGDVMGSRGATGQPWAGMEWRLMGSAGAVGWVGEGGWRRGKEERVLRPGVTAGVTAGVACSSSRCACCHMSAPGTAAL